MGVEKIDIIYLYLKHWVTQRCWKSVQIDTLRAMILLGQTNKSNRRLHLPLQPLTALNISPWQQQYHQLLTSATSILFCIEILRFDPDYYAIRDQMLSYPVQKTFSP